jgi:outer membrane receptor protein involved in Fe transport
MVRSATSSILAIAAIFLICGRSVPAAAEDANPSATDSAASEPSKEDDLDRLMNMDLEQLSQVPVSVINPIVEGISKKPETLSESPGVAQVITAEEIRAFGAKNLFEVLNWATSVYTSGSYLYPDNMVSIRGDMLTHNDNHRLVLINGRPFRDVQEGGLNASIYLAFPLDAIHHIEIIRGPGSVLYGSNAYTGVINIVTKTVDDPTSRGAVLAGSFGTQKYDLTQGNGNDQGGYLVSATYGRQEGWPFTATGEGPPVQNPAFTGSTLRGYDDVGVFAQAYQGGFTATTFVASTSQTHLGAVPTWPTGTAGDLEMNRVFVDLAYELEPSFGGKTDVHFTYNFLGHEWQLPPPGVTSVSHSYLIEATQYLPIGEDLDLVIGGVTDIHQGEAAAGPRLWKSGTALTLSWNTPPQTGSN